MFPLGENLPFGGAFFVLATQNPIEQEGTYHLPEAQRTVFFSKSSSITRVVTRKGKYRGTTSTFESKLEPVLDGKTILECQETVKRVPVPEHVYDFILDLVRMARPKEESSPKWVKDLIDWGPGPRGMPTACPWFQSTGIAPWSLSCDRGRRGGSAHPVLRHRIVPTFNAEAEGISVEHLIDRLLEDAPKKKKA